MEECGICLEEVNKNSFIFFQCQHKVCSICYPKVLNIRSECPICNYPITINLHPRESYEDMQNIERGSFIFKTICFIIIILIVLLIYNGIPLV